MRVERPDFDGLMTAICRRLSRSFGLATMADEIRGRPLPTWGCPECVAFLPDLGIEIEVPFSSFFPDLWARYSLAERGIRGLEIHELEALSRECVEPERALREKLALTVAAGIPRGNDRYWEFSLPPAREVALLVEAVRLLTAAGVLPRGRRHSLHLTISGLHANRDAYTLLGVLEALHVTPERLASGLVQSRQAIHTGWARKGKSGILEKGAADLLGPAPCAVELRTLQLPGDDMELQDLLARAQGWAHAIAHTDKSPWWSIWCSVRDLFRHQLHDLGLPDANWWTSGPAGGVDFESWTRFVEALPGLRAGLEEAATPEHDARAELESLRG